VPGVIQLPTEGLTPVERHGLALLVDLSRVLPAPAAAATVRLDLVAGGSEGLEALADEPGIDDGVIRVTRNAVRTFGEIGGMVAEQRASERDRLGRVPSSANPLVQAWREREPVLSTYASGIRRAAARAAGDRPFRAVAPWPDGKRWAAALTHDLDVVALWPAFTGLRAVELLQKGEWGQLGRTLGAALGATFGTPVREAALEILAIEQEAGIRSTWYIICGTPTWHSWKKGDVTYTPESRATRAILAAIAASGSEIGLHGSMVTAEDPLRFLEQAERLGALAPTRGTGVRQHFLRMDPGPTQRGMIRAGFQHDATIGFSDTNGFRLGIADIVPWYDAAGDTNTPLEAVPFCWMDRTQSKYQGVEDPMEWARVALETAGRCRDVEGFWSGIWHPNLSAPLGYPGAPEAYRAIVRGLTSDPTAWVTTVGEAVRWRKARRAVAAVGIGAGGEVIAQRPIGSAPVWLEDGHGVRREEAKG
jgi:hypothetical protein